MFDARQQAPPEVVDGFTVKDVAQFGSATLHEAAGRIGALPAAIRAMTPSSACAGPAVTVACPPADNLWLHRAVYRCDPGAVLLADVTGAYEWGYWGEVLSCAAAERRIAGVVINGCVRDIPGWPTRASRSSPAARPSEGPTSIPTARERSMRIWWSGRSPCIPVTGSSGTRTESC